MEDYNIFKRLETFKELSPEAKKELLSDIESVRLLMDLGDLFSQEFGDVFGEFLQNDSKDGD